MREPEFRRRLVEQVAAGPGTRVVDLGCGTGTLALALAHRYPESRIVGIDLDPEILAIARQKIQPSAAPIQWVQASVTTLPVATGTLDRVVSSLVFHHLDGAQKRAGLTEALRSLRPGGQLHFADWGKPDDWLMSLAFLPVRILDGFAMTEDNARGRMATLIQEAGFQEIEETGRMRTAFGVLVFHRAVRP